MKRVAGGPADGTAHFRCAIPARTEAGGTLAATRQPALATGLRQSGTATPTLTSVTAAAITKTRSLLSSGSLGRTKKPFLFLL